MYTVTFDNLTACRIIVALFVSWLWYPDICLLNQFSLFKGKGANKALILFHLLPHKFTCAIYAQITMSHACIPQQT